MPGTITQQSPEDHPQQIVMGAVLKRLRQLEKRITDLETTQANEGDLITTADVCRLLNIHVNTWIRWLKTYPKPPMRFGSPGAYTYRKSSVVRFARQIGKEHMLSKSINRNNGNKKRMSTVKSEGKCSGTHV